MTELSIEDYRQLARERCERAVGGAEGRRVDDAVYREVTEGRDRGPGYSSCGDLPHWLLFRLGIRAPYINRDEHLGWRSGVNISRLCAPPIGSGAGGAARRPRDGEIFETGDILICWARPNTTDAHVFVCAQHSNSAITSWDYGQGPMSAKAWSTSRAHLEARRRHRGARLNASGLWVLDDGRFIRSVLSLEEAIEMARVAGQLVAPDHLGDETSDTMTVTEPAPSTTTLPETIRRGSKGETVSKWQQIVAGLVVDGDFGPRTDARTREWQRARGLFVDGIVGPRSWREALGYA